MSPIFPGGSPTQNLTAGGRQLNQQHDAEQDAALNAEATLVDQLPACFRVDEDLFASDGFSDLNWIEQELDPKRLHKITHLLWLAGRPVPPRPLHHQLVLGRNIIASERIDMHMVWGQGRIFIKPLPRYLLDTRFWREHLTCSCASMSPKMLGDESHLVPNCACGRQRLRGCALGLLLHYAALITYESDFAIAVERHLIPFDISWPRWRRFVREILHHNGGDGSPRAVYSGAAERFVYGELRINRLNLIHVVRVGPFSNFFAMWNSYGSFYRDNWALIVGGTAWILLILSAMQVGLGTTKLSDNETFQAASYGFTVFSIVGPLGGFMIMMGLFASAMFYNYLRTRRFEVARQEKLGRVWGQQRKERGDTVPSRKVSEDVPVVDGQSRPSVPV